MVKKLLLGLALILTLSSCKQIILWKYGITRPKEETPESLLVFLAKMNQPADEIYIFKDSVSYLRCMDDSIFHKNILNSMFFTKDGILDKFKDSSLCQWSGGYYIKSLRNDTIYHINKSYRYQDILSEFRPLKDQQRPLNADSVYDFIALVTWGKFAGKLNERQFITDDFAASNYHSRIRVIFLDCDVMKSWNLNKNKFLSIK